MAGGDASVCVAEQLAQSEKFNAELGQRAGVGMAQFVEADGGNDLCRLARICQGADRVVLPPRFVVSPDEDLVVGAAVRSQLAKEVAALRVERICRPRPDFEGRL